MSSTTKTRLEASSRSVDDTTQHDDNTQHADIAENGRRHSYQLLPDASGDLRPPPKPPLTVLEHAICVITMLMLFSWLYVGPMLTFAALGYAVLFKDPRGYLVIAILLAEIIMPARTYWPVWVHLPLWELWRRYFSFRYIVPAGVDLSRKRYLFLHFPHGTFPLGSWLSIGASQAEGTGMPSDIHAFGASVFLYLPLLRHVMAWMGVHGASKQEMLRVLQKHSAGYTPEGIAGIFAGCSRDRERIFLQSRKGFCKVAIQAGVDIVPVYQLGQSQLFRFWGSERLSRSLRATVGVLWGRWGLPIPFQTDLLVAVGLPVPVKQDDDPPREAVEALHARVVQEVKDLYMRHRADHPGWDKRELEIV